MPQASDNLTAPDCSGTPVADCVRAFAEAGFTASPTITWDDGADRPVGTVIQSSPEAGTSVPVDKANRPIEIRCAGVVVPTPRKLETFDDYRADLIDAGFTSIEVRVLPHDRNWLDGPADAVTVIEPRPGTAIDPTEVATQVVVVSKNGAVMPQIGR